MIYLTLILFIIVIEVVIKTFIEKNHLYGRYLLNRHIYINAMNNYGVSGGFFDKYSNKLKRILAVFLVAFTGIYLLFIAFNRKISNITKLSFALILGGGWSNLLDRYQFGYVKDYFSIMFNKCKKISRIVFNLADIFVFLGGMLYIVRRILKGKV